MDKTLQTTAWNCLPKEFREEVKETYREYTEKISAKTESEHRIIGYIAAQTELELLFGIHNLTSDAEGEEMLTVPRSKVQEEYAILSKELSHRETDAEDYIAWNYAKMTFEELFGSKCLPDEAGKEVNFASKDPKFKHKIGDKVRIVNDISHNNKYKGDITEIVYVDESDPNMPYKVDIYDEEFGGGLWYQESDLEPYTEPREKPNPTNSGELKSQEADKQFDNIIKDSFREHNRLHIAAMAMAGLLANEGVSCFTDVQDLKHMDFITYHAFEYADKLIKKSEEENDI